MSPFGFEERPIRITVCGHSHPGAVRAENQDHFLVADLSIAPDQGGTLLHREMAPPHAAPRHDEFTLGPTGALALVADGMGGAAAGTLASRLTVAWIYEALTTRIAADRNNAPRAFALRLRQVVEEVNARIYQKSRREPDLQGMGSTATVVGILDGFLYLAQVGDSRAYLIRNGTAHQLTHDQSLIQQLIDAGALSPEEAEQSSQRNIILQALGTEPVVRPELTYQELRRGDTLILCSDGLHGSVRREEIASLGTMPDPAAACSALIDLANARGGPDNITVVTLRFAGEGLPIPREDDSVGRKLFS